MWQRILLGLSLLLNIFLGARFCFSAQGAPGYRDLSRQRAALEEELAQLEAQNIALTREIRLLENDDRYIRRLVRERIHSIRSGEVLYLFPEQERGEAADKQKNLPNR